MDYSLGALYFWFGFFFFFLPVVCFFLLAVWEFGSFAVLLVVSLVFCLVVFAAHFGFIFLNGFDLVAFDWVF